MKKLLLSIIALAHFGAQAQWTNVPSSRLTNISCGSASLVAGCDAAGFGWHLNTGTDALVQAPTTQSITNVSMCVDGTLFFIGMNNNVSRVLNFSGTFSGSQTNGQVVNVSGQNANYAVGANSGQSGANLYSFNGSNWALLAGGGNLNKVAVGDDGATFGVFTANNSIYSHNGSTWAAESGSLSHVAVANASMIVGISNGDLLRRVGTTFSLFDVPRPNGAAIIDVDIAADGTIYVLTNEATNNVYRSDWATLISCTPLASGTSISGPPQLCAGETATFTAAAVSNATSYTWTLSNGWTGSSTTNTIEATAPNTGGQQLALTVTSNNACFTGSPAFWGPTVVAEPVPLTISASLNACAGGTGAYSASPANGGITWAYPNGWSTSSVYPNENGGVFVQGDAGYVVFTKTNACFEISDSVYINVYQGVPTPPVLGAGQEYLCFGQQMFFSYSVDSTASSSTISFTAFNTAWGVQADTDTSMYVTPQNNGGPHAFTMIAYNTCGSSSTVLTLTTNVNYVSSYAAFQQIGADLVANDYSGAPYFENLNHQWILDGTAIPGATALTYTPLVSGDYAVEVSFVDFPCAPHTTASQYIEVIVTGVDENGASRLSIYPNPFNTEFVIETTALTTISVMNAMGQVVLSRTINGRTSIDAATLPTGIYFVREETSGAVMKLVKN